MTRLFEPVTWESNKPSTAKERIPNCQAEKILPGSFIVYFRSHHNLTIFSIKRSCLTDANETIHRF